MAVHARLRRGAAGIVGLASLAAAGDVAALDAYVRRGDAIEAPLGGRTGDALRGRGIVTDRALGNCLICHHVPIPSEPFQGDAGPDLAGAGARLTPGQLRLRLVDQSLINPETMMPPFYRVQDLKRVAPAFARKPILDEQQVEDVVAWLVSLKEVPQ